MAFSFFKKNTHKAQKQETNEAADQQQTVNQVVMVPLGNIVPNRFQPRKHFNDARISELAGTIKEHGLLQPIVLREYESDHYEIIAGERRFRAVRSANCASKHRPLTRRSRGRPPAASSGNCGAARSRSPRWPGIWPRPAEASKVTALMPNAKSDPSKPRNWFHI